MLALRPTTADFVTSLRVPGAWEDGVMKATLHTTMGDVTIVLFPEAAPKTVESFAGLATGEAVHGRRRPHQSDPVLRRAPLPPRHLRVHDPGRLPARSGCRRPGLHLRRRDQSGPQLRRALQARHG